MDKPTLTGAERAATLNYLNWCLDWARKGLVAANAAHNAVPCNMTQNQRLHWLSVIAGLNFAIANTKPRKGVVTDADDSRPWLAGRRP
jgi:hypothetical protein